MSGQELQSRLTTETLPTKAILKKGYLCPDSLLDRQGLVELGGRHPRLLPRRTLGRTAETTSRDRGSQTSPLPEN